MDFKPCRFRSSQPGRQPQSVAVVPRHNNASPAESWNVYSAGVMMSVFIVLLHHHHHHPHPRRRRPHRVAATEDDGGSGTTLIEK